MSRTTSHFFQIGMAAQLKHGLVVAALALSACGGKAADAGKPGAPGTSESAKGEEKPVAPPLPLAEILGTGPTLWGDLTTAKFGGDLAAQPAGMFVEDARSKKKDPKSSRYLSYGKEFSDGSVQGYFQKGELVQVSARFQRSVRAEIEKAWGKGRNIGDSSEVLVWANPKTGLRAKYDETKFGDKAEGTIEITRYTPIEGLLGKGNVAFEKADAPILGADMTVLAKSYADLLYVESAEEGKAALEGAAKLADNAEIAKLAPTKASARFELPPPLFEDSTTSDMWVNLSFDEAGKVRSYRLKIPYAKKDPTARDEVKKAIDDALGTATEGEEYGDKIWTYPGGFKVEEDTIGDGWDIEREVPKPVE